MNKITLVGRIGQDIELKGEGDKKYTRFSLAVRKGKDETDWFNCTAFGNTANTLCNWCEKGSQIALSGRMTSSKKDDRIYWNVEVNEVEIIDFKKKEEVQPTDETAPTGHTSIKANAIDPKELPFF